MTETGTKSRPKSRKGRGRLSAIDRLPPECRPAIDKAVDALRDREKTQTEIYEAFHIDLEAILKEHRGELEFTIPSISAFNRMSLNMASVSMRMDMTREITGVLAEKFDAGASDDLTVIAAEAIKTLVFEIVTQSGEAGVDPKGAMQLASALRSAAQAQGVSTDRRVKVQKEFGEQVEEAMDKVQKETGMSSDTAQEIIDKILGRAS